MQLRMSPGGSTSKSRRSRPELPPSSGTGTTAGMSIAGGVDWAYFFSPWSSAESPVPPPMETIRSGREAGPGVGGGPSSPEGSRLFFGVEQPADPRVFADAVEIGVLPGDHPVSRL